MVEGCAVNRRSWALVALLAGTALLFALWWTRPQRVERTALLMDTSVRVVVYAPRGEAGTAADAALDLIEHLESLWHPGRPDSDVARVNASAGVSPVSVAPETVRLAQMALQVAEETAGRLRSTTEATREVIGVFEALADSIGSGVAQVRKTGAQVAAVAEAHQRLRALAERIQQLTDELDEDARRFPL